MKCIDQQTQLWAHVICVNWNPEIYFSDEYKTKIAGSLNKKRFELCCSFCRKRTGRGACIQCDYKTCGASYHVRCAVRKGLIIEWSQMEERLQTQDEDNWFIPVFCEKH